MIDSYEKERMRKNRINSSSAFSSDSGNVRLFLIHARKEGMTPAINNPETYEAQFAAAEYSSGLAS